MALRKQPNFWLELVTREYPGGSPATDETLRVSTTPLAFPTFVQGRVKAGGWSAIERALSDWRGNPEASTVTAECEDSDGAIRNITEQIGVTAYAKAETCVKFLSEAGRKAGLTPRIIHRGYLTRAPKPLPKRKARIETVDAAASHWFNLDPQAPLQKVFINREHLEFAGIKDTPEGVLGKPYNIVIGEHSDVGVLNANGGDASKGMVPPDFLGYRIVTADTIVTESARPAYAFIGSNGNIADGDEVEIGTVTYTFRNTVSSAYDVKRGSTSRISKDNLIAAINGSAGEGTLYGTGTDAHPDVTAAYHITVNPAWGDDDNVQVRWRVPGAVGNGTAVSADSPFGFFHEGGIPTPTLEGGVDAGPVPTDVVTAIPPPVLSAERVGTAGTQTVSYAVSMVTASGETVWSNIVTITDSLPTSQQDASNYNRLTWTAPTGWSDVYDDQAVAFRIGGRVNSSPTSHLAVQLLSVEPDWEYHDTGSHSEQGPPAPAVSTATVVTQDGEPATVTTSSEWGLLVWALGYSKLTRLYGSDLADGAAPARTLLDPDHPDLLTPISAAWPHVTPWIELPLPEGGSVRVSGFYAKGPLLEHHKAGTVTFAVNCCGMTETGDDTGRQITEASEGYIWVMNELALKDDGQGYRTGAFWPLEAFTDGTTVLNTTVIRAFQAATVNFIGGRGYQIHLCLTQTITLNQFEQWFNTTFTSYTGDLDNGQRAVWVIDDEADPAAARHYRYRIEIADSLPEPDIADDEVENYIAAKCDWDPDAQKFRGDPIVLQNTPSQDMYGLRSASPKDQFLELRCTRDRVTATDAMARRLLHNKVAPIYQPMATSLLGIEQELGSLLRLTHPDGTGVNGYENRPFFTVRKRIDPNGPRQRVTLKARDVYRPYATAARVASDSESATWDLATADERATYVFAADDDDTVPSQGVPGKEAR